MGKCATCHNEYDKSFTVIFAGNSYEFDSFECAINTLAPTCSHCSCRVIGHGVEDRGEIFCCAHCARHEGVEGITDRK